MRVLRGDPASWAATTPDGSAVSIGVFDGVHRGHRVVLADLADRARQSGGLDRVVITFDEHPLRVVAPEAAPNLLTSEEQRLELFEQLGIDVVALLPFRQVRDFTPDEFIKKVLVEAFHARIVAVGSDFRFGRDRVGDVALLRKAGDVNGFEVDTVQLLSEGGHPLSSTEIRIMIAAGRVENAGEALGRPFELRGRVVPGDGRGQAIGIPTANLDVDPQLVIPGRGVYAAWVPRGGTRYAAAVNVGIRPTFGGEREIVEVHLLDFTGDLYGEELSVHFQSRVRDEQNFESVEALVAQLDQDLEEVRQRLAEVGGS
jgi:riboflavin kinase/FMN adenylyltransferase